MNIKELENAIDILEKNFNDGNMFENSSRLYQANAAIRTYNQYMDDLEVDPNESFIEKTNKTLQKFLDLKGKFYNLAIEYLEHTTPYINFMMKKVAGLKRENEREAQHEIMEKSKNVFCELCDVVVETLNKTGIIDRLVRRENNGLRELGLENFISVEEYKKELLPQRSLRNANSFSEEIRNSAMCLFWVNKISKVMDECMIGYMMGKRSSLPGNNKSEEEQKMIALLRVDLMKKIFRYADNRFDEDAILGSDEDFEFFLDSAGVRFDFLEFVKYMLYNKERQVGGEKMKQYYAKHPEYISFYDRLPTDFKEDIYEIEERYNEMFVNEGVSKSLTFLYDIFLVCQIYELQKIIYSVKSELTTVLMFLLSTEKMATPSPYCKVWGIANDKMIQNESNVSKVLYVELPGFIKPLMVHIEDMLIEENESFAEEIPEYKGIFKGANSSRLDNYLATNALYRLNDKQKSALKKRRDELKKQVTKRKKEIDKMPESSPKEKSDKKTQEKIWLRDCKYYRVLEYMNAMAKDKPRSTDIEI